MSIKDRISHLGLPITDILVSEVTTQGAIANSARASSEFTTGELTPVEKVTVTWSTTPTTAQLDQLKAALGGAAFVIEDGPAPAADFSDLTPLYWWCADEGWVDDAGSITWTDQIAGVELTNADHHTVDFGTPERFRSPSVNWRNVVNFSNGALGGAITPMSASSEFTIVLIFSGTSSDHTLWGGASTLNNQEFAVEGFFHQLFSSGPRTWWPNNGTGMRVAQWVIGGDRTQASTILYHDKTTETRVGDTGPTTVIDADASFLVVGAQPNGTNPLTFAGTSIEHVMIFERAVSKTDHDDIVDRQAAADAGTSYYISPTHVSTILVYGQSNAAAKSTIAQDTDQRFGGALTWDDMMLTWVNDVDGGADPTRSGLAPLVEFTRESGAVQMCRLADQVLIDAGGHDDWTDLSRVLFVSNAAVDGKAIAALRDTAGADYIRLKADMDAVPALCETSSFDWFIWVQGTSDYGAARGAYQTELETMWAQVKTDGSAAGYDTSAPVMLIGQSATHRFDGGGAEQPYVPLDQFAARTTDVEVALPLYCTYWQDGVHMSTLGQRLKGAYFGKVIGDIEAGTGFTPVHMSEILTWTDTEITVRIAGGNGTYAEDSSFVGVATNKGFDVYSSADVLEDIISAVSLAGDVVTITLSSPASSSAKICYGWGRATGMTAPSNTPIPLGNIRDTDSRTVDIDLTTYNLHNYCVICDIDRPIV